MLQSLPIMLFSISLIFACYACFMLSGFIMLIIYLYLIVLIAVYVSIPVYYLLVFLAGQPLK